MCACSVLKSAATAGRRGARARPFGRPPLGRSSRLLTPLQDDLARYSSGRAADCGDSTRAGPYDLGTDAATSSRWSRPRARARWWSAMPTLLIAPSTPRARRAATSPPRSRTTTCSAGWPRSTRRTRWPSRPVLGALLQMAETGFRRRAHAHGEHEPRLRRDGGPAAGGGVSSSLTATPPSAPSRLDRGSRGARRGDRVGRAPVVAGHAHQPVVPARPGPPRARGAPASPSRSSTTAPSTGPTSPPPWCGGSRRADRRCLRLRRARVRVPPRGGRRRGRSARGGRSPSTGSKATRRAAPARTRARDEQRAHDERVEQDAEGDR